MTMANKTLFETGFESPACFVDARPLKNISDSHRFRSGSLPDGMAQTCAFFVSETVSLIERSDERTAPCCELVEFLFCLINIVFLVVLA